MHERLRAAAEAVVTPLGAFRNALRVQMAGLELFTAATELVTAAMALEDPAKTKAAAEELSASAGRIAASGEEFEVILGSLERAILELVEALGQTEV